MTPEIPRVESTQSIGTRIGEGLDVSGSLGDEPMQRTLDAIDSYTRALGDEPMHIYAIATSAVRRAQNGATFAERVRVLVGVPLHVLSGAEEAAASYRGAITALAPLHDRRAGVVDIGGGSTEYAIGTAAQPERTTSCEIGAVRLTEVVPSLAGNDGIVRRVAIERARERARAALAPLGTFPIAARVACVGGSATTTVAIICGKRQEQATFELTRNDLEHTLALLCSLSLKERKSVPGMVAQRADILPAGIILLDTVLEILEHESAVVTSADLLIGYLLQQRDAGGIAS